MTPARMLCWVLLLASACEAGPSPRPGPARFPGRETSPTVIDKQAMFGSASLIPTREGERARRELAIASELEQALAQLGLGPAHVDVELREPITVIVIATLPDDREAERAEATVDELARAMLPDLDATNLHLWWQPARAESPAPVQPRGLGWAVLLCCLGLGLSLGVIAERLRSRR